MFSIDQSGLKGSYCSHRAIEENGGQSGVGQTHLGRKYLVVVYRGDILGEFAFVTPLIISYYPNIRSEDCTGGPIDSRYSMADAESEIQ